MVLAKSYSDQDALPGRREYRRDETGEGFADGTAVLTCGRMIWPARRRGEAPALCWPRMAAPSIPADRRVAALARPTGSLRTVPPIIEPLWEGIHVLAHVRGGRARLIDQDGDDIGGQFRALLEAIEHDVASEEAVIDGWVTNQATRSGEGLALITVEPPRGVGLLRPQPGPPASRRTIVPRSSPSWPSTSWCSTGDAPGPPLLERKRLLDAVIVTSELVRSSPYVRPARPLAALLAGRRVPRCRPEGRQRQVRARRVGRRLVGGAPHPRR
jgi:hypothetical protein